MKAIFTVLTLALISFNTWAIDATHGMVIFGTEKLMAYHLPMFHNIHAKHVVLEYTLPAEIKAKLLSYQQTGFVTFVPAPFDLQKFLEKPFDLKGDLYYGHFEKDGELVMSDVTLENTKVIYQSDISKENESGIDSYKLFGTPQDLYLVHMLDGGKQADHIMKASIDIGMNHSVEYTATAINKGYKLFSYSGLLKDGTTSTMNLPLSDIMNKQDPACYPLITRACKLWDYHQDNELELVIGKTYFSDDVM